jgi:hypothetical protein
MDSEKRRFWAVVALNLTVAARGTYVPQSEKIAEPAKLRANNEMLHRVCSRLAAEDDDPDSWLFSFLREMSERTGTAEAVQWAIDDAKLKAPIGFL